MRFRLVSTRYSMSGTGCRYESPATGFRPALLNSAARNWMATSEPRWSERRPSSASEARKVRSARKSLMRMRSRPGRCARAAEIAAIAHRDWSLSCRVIRKTKITFPRAPITERPPPKELAAVVSAEKYEERAYCGLRIFRRGSPGTSPQEPAVSCCHTTAPATIVATGPPRKCRPSNGEFLLLEKERFTS